MKVSVANGFLLYIERGSGQLRFFHASLRPDAEVVPITGFPRTPQGIAHIGLVETGICTYPFEAVAIGFRSDDPAFIDLRARRLGIQELVERETGRHWRPDQHVSRGANFVFHHTADAIRNPKGGVGFGASPKAHIV